MNTTQEKQTAITTRLPVFIEGRHRKLMGSLPMPQQYALEKVAEKTELLLMLSNYLGRAEQKRVMTMCALPPTTTSKKPSYVQKNKLEVLSFEAAQRHELLVLDEKITKIREARFQADLDLLAFVISVANGDAEAFTDRGSTWTQISRELEYP